MGNHAGVRLDYKQEISDEIMDRAKAECEFSEKLYDLIFEYQERLSARGCKTWAKRLTESERVGDLNLPLSRLYNQIWSSVMGLQEKAKQKKKNKQQMEVIA